MDMQLVWTKMGPGEKTKKKNTTSALRSGGIHLPSDNFCPETRRDLPALRQNFVNNVMESPRLPVLEGEDVMLHCLHINKTTKEIASNLRATFYKNDRVLKWGTQGNWTLTAETKADEGLYKCVIHGHRDTHESWITVKALNEDDQKKRDLETT
ncbi:sialoadhesin-like isoform X2 [Pagrus major]|uniref:sialoadhesin-like isoform X2 n=1 Tax=Pagrus major TaxID=143350 RepID=UPI003CC8BADF